MVRVTPGGSSTAGAAPLRRIDLRWSDRGDRCAIVVASGDDRERREFALADVAHLRFVQDDAHGDSVVRAVSLGGSSLELQFVRPVVPGILDGFP
jgi:hypothetical protein